MINLIVHPGFSKSGTTFLQDKILRKIDCNLLSKVLCDSLGIMQYDTVFYKLFKKNYFPEKNPFKKDKLLPHYYLREKYKNYLIDSFSKKEKTFILSDGGMLGGIHLNGLSNLYLFKEIIDEIVTQKQIQIKIKFIITIRNQFDLIRSHYNFFNHFSDISFESLIEKICDNNDKSFYYFFELASLVKSVKKIFNCEILLLPLEKLMHDPDNYKKDLENFLNIKIDILKEELSTKVNINHIIKDDTKQYIVKRPNISYFYYALSKLHVVMKKYNFYQKNFRKSKLLKFIYQIFKPAIKRKMQKPLRNELELKKKIFEIYSNSNHEMARITGVDLKKYNYY
tara:strand:+ start:838 stop:1854 length:1017 start_codon:yes stop_codon:yes gene_type:complete